MANRIIVSDVDTSGDPIRFVQRANLPQTISDLAAGTWHVLNTTMSEPVEVLALPGQLRTASADASIPINSGHSLTDAYAAWHTSVRDTMQTLGITDPHGQEFALASMPGSSMAARWGHDFDVTWPEGGYFGNGRTGIYGFDTLLITEAGPDCFVLTCLYQIDIAAYDALHGGVRIPEGMTRQQAEYYRALALRAAQEYEPAGWGGTEGGEIEFDPLVTPDWLPDWEFDGTDVVIGAPEADGLPVVTGDTLIGETLTATPPGWLGYPAPTSTSGLWSTSPDGETWTPTAETGATITLLLEHVGLVLRYTATATNTEGTAIRPPRSPRAHRWQRPPRSGCTPSSGRRSGDDGRRGTRGL